MSNSNLYLEAKRLEREMRHKRRIIAAIKREDRKREEEMSNALPVRIPECSMCRETCTMGTYRVNKNPEVFCSLQCCRIFYGRPNSHISVHRKEAASEKA